MSELTDDQLDGLFRKSAEEFETSFDPEAWQDMSARLDRNDRGAPTGGASLVATILRWGLPVLLLLLLGVGGWSVYRPAKNPPDPAVLSPSGAESGTPQLVAGKKRKTPAATQVEDVEKVNSEADRVPKPTSIADEPEPDRKTNTPDRKIMGNRTDETPIPLTATGSTPDNLSFGKTTKPTDAVPVSVIEKKRADRTKLGKLSVTAITTGTTTSLNRVRKRKSTGNSLPGRTRVKPFANELATGFENRYGMKSRASLTNRSSTPKLSGFKVMEERPSAASASRENEAPGMTDASTAVALPALAELAIRPAQWPKPLSFTNRPVDVHPDTIASKAMAGKIVPKADPMRGLSVRFVVAPDLSGVGLKNFARPGTNVGLLLEYRLASRWSVQAGLIQSTKVYKANASEYTAPPELWASPMKSPLSVDGRCNMFDIPINVRYDVVLKPRLDGRLPTRWFASTGVTSYIMKNEEYYYTYPPHTYNQPTEHYASTGGYGFSNLNLSVGYERALSRRLSWQVEPFMKVPLKGVGYFKVNLLSTGAFFSIRYKL